MLRRDIIVLGKIAAACGLPANCAFYPFADPSTWLGHELPHWWVGREGDAPDLWRQTRLIQCRVRNELLIARLACAADRTAAEAMRGLLVGVAASSVAADRRG